jgi:hypothetical protein
MSGMVTLSRLVASGSGKRAGDTTQFANGTLTNTAVQPLSGGRAEKKK